MLINNKSKICNISIHSIGNASVAQPLLISKSPIDINDENLNDLLLNFLLQPFSIPEYYSFTFSNSDFTYNPVYRFVNDMLESTKIFHEVSIDIAKYLYEISVHPQIKSGDLFVVKFNNLTLDNTMYDAVGIFKSESKHSFLKLDNFGNDFKLSQIDGISTNKIDKGCLIINTNKDDGYKVCVIDNTNKSADAHYWKNDFLNVKPINDSYHNTNDYLSLCKKFVTTQFPKEYEVNKTDQIELLNNSINYFKEQDEFDVKNFAAEVIKDPQVIESFNEFKKHYEHENNIEFANEFEISNEAVKKQNRNFKSVLKLDRNFHIYIHGDRNLIEKGTDPKSGKQFYKIFFDEET